MIRIILFGLLLSGAAAGEDSPYLERGDYLRCLSHAERASQKAVLGQPKGEDLWGIAECNPEQMHNLEPEQIRQYRKVLQLVNIQNDAPSAVIHGELIREIQAFIRMLD